MPRKKRFPYLYLERSHRGQPRWYVRRGKGARVRLRAIYDTPAFWAEYRAALEGTATAPIAPRTHTLGWALERYRHSPAWAALSNATRKQSEAIYRTVVDTAGTERLTDITTDVIRAGRDRRAAAPHAANNFVKAMRRFFKWATDPDSGGLVADNPMAGVKLLKGRNTDGFHTWTAEEIERYERHWPLGTRERLALDLMLYTGLARGDVVRLGRQHISGGVITFRMEKNRGDGIVYPPLLPVLAATIEATEKKGDLTFLVTERGTPFVKESFGNWFREAARAAKCPGSAHGLRKAGATRAAENGATVNQLMALFGWGTEKMALVYTRKADRKRLAATAGPLLLRAQSENEISPHLPESAGQDANSLKKSGG